MSAPLPEPVSIKYRDPTPASSQFRQNRKLAIQVQLGLDCLLQRLRLLDLRANSSKLGFQTQVWCQLLRLPIHLCLRIMLLRNINLTHWSRVRLQVQICKILVALAQTSQAEAFPAQGSLAKTWPTCLALLETHRDRALTKLVLNQMDMEPVQLITHWVGLKKCLQSKPTKLETFQGQLVTTNNPIPSPLTTLTNKAPLIPRPISLWHNRIQARIFASQVWSLRRLLCKSLSTHLSSSNRRIL